MKICARCRYNNRSSSTIFRGTFSNGFCGLLPAYGNPSLADFSSTYSSRSGSIVEQCTDYTELLGESQAKSDTILIENMAQYELA